MPTTKQKIYLSPPHMSGLEQTYVQDAFETNWIAPLGPHVDAFEREFCEVTGAAHAAALTSGTAALHLAMILLGVGPGDEVLGSTFTFSASVNPITYCGARPTFIDSERTSWNMDPALLRETLAKRAQAGKLPKAVVVVDLYGQSADLDAIKAACDEYGVPLVEDAAAAVGTTYKGRATGTVGKFGAFSFNGNKIITTSGGGMLVSDDGAAIAHARKLATQARDPAVHYLHTEIGYNYRLSNVLAAIGRGQLVVIEDRVAKRRENYDAYVRALGDVPGITFQPEAPWGRHSRWLINILIDPQAFGADREVVRQALAAEEIEARPLWKPMHTQPVFTGCEHVGGAVAEELFETGLSLPSGSTLTEDDLARVVGVIRRCVR
ncbi:MAG: aminotransferase class I/II-fold pyridoxal phosphate-dependent enzyme [Thermomicrobia bacterium]|nr:aminotransferase class I/II-fold pyridoxal phosphate-dependent enzyme [Thermomicrobia bacterium]MCA1723321.1 aminotransferase class I/II-fold pyridoxal phosphate-dependent enzyme [Thermomicrobia bacterium]